MIKAQTLKGFRDFLPVDAIKRQFVVGKIKTAFERFGFDPLETPALEYAETLLGKYGDEADKLLYVFEDRGGRKVGMRYDQTVPLARVVAQYQNLPKPFKRYQIQPVWRAENPQKGRYREFLQCDADIVGDTSPLSDAEVIALAIKTIESLGFRTFRVFINDRTLFDDIPLSAITIVDKLKKIGEEGVKKELLEKKFDPSLLSQVKNNKPTQNLRQILTALSSLGVSEKIVQFEPTLARGLDYYTGTIFEIAIDGYLAGSVCGGGRYDNLIGQFTGKDVPAVGFAFGFDRIVEAMEQFNLLPNMSTVTRALVTAFENIDSRTLTSSLRKAGINTELFYEPAKLDKQLKYADRKGIPYVIIQGPDEVKRGVVKLKNLQTKEQEELAVEEVIKKLKEFKGV
ncbi:histidine--tRNA ligase [Candidatus Gottesmanbacteria bacterium RIFCSPLOWO2_01_FULL_43_11b]|uniref:Histidine--tRNA ligase n=1 Tax=Candidatus Gottesmanbacteria bacterium RIFCSPLOWO2_01_FULL_43_11b TaxID=1798392 RepID=A0A1F6AJ44_9BACT|nr:MAG: histidine--tRNA ligase [Candidatus Gottesmanbacteria bacterium RIFCSPLOWO2_01_FULL_43_11b]